MQPLTGHSISLCNAAQPCVLAMSMPGADLFAGYVLRKEKKDEKDLGQVRLTSFYWKNSHTIT